MLHGADASMNDKPSIFVKWVNNNSKRYDGKIERVFVDGIVAINNCPHCEPNIDELSVGDSIEYECMYKRGRVQVWHGIVLSLGSSWESSSSHVESSPNCVENSQSDGRHDQTKTESSQAERRREQFETEASQAEGHRGHDDTENSDLVPPRRSTPKRKRPNSIEDGIQKKQ